MTDIDIDSFKVAALEFAAELIESRLEGEPDATAAEAIRWLRRRAAGMRLDVAITTGRRQAEASDG